MNAGQQPAVDISDTLQAVDGKYFASEKVFVAVLKHLQQESSKF